MIVFYVLAVFAVIQGVISLREGFRAAAHLRNFRPKAAWRPQVVVFCPCKGVDPEFEKNIRSVLDQDYSNFRAVFIVDSDRDPAFDVLRRLSATVVVAGEAGDRGQKVHNLLYAVDHAAGAAEVFAFCDADARFSRYWLASLVAPLEDGAVGVSTGYRWYAPTGGMASVMRSIWNASAVTLLGDHSRNFAWGGSMALRREIFDRIRVREEWAGCVSDDFAVTHAARAAGMRIVFVPLCLTPSYGNCTWTELLEFTTRQLIITRVYDPGMWRMALFSQTLFNVAFWSSAVLAWNHVSAGVMFCMISGLAATKGWTRLEAVVTALPENTLSNRRWSYILGFPLSALLYQYNLLRSACTRDIVWRQIHYSLLSPHRTVVWRDGAN
jgi:cellulose synthase/poly-beta-1,6-N-acetylglucosamine synthase-like glycosyltransferase